MSNEKPKRTRWGIQMDISFLEPLDELKWSHRVPREQLTNRMIRLGIHLFQQLDVSGKSEFEKLEESFGLTQLDAPIGDL